MEIPKHFLSVPYNSQYHPGGSNNPDIRYGSNCQRFVYELLQHFSYLLPMTYRSSELWSNTVFTHKVRVLKQYDIVFFNASPSSFGAHIGIYNASGAVLHLSKVVGKPALWSLSEFMKYPQYRYFIGAKRPHYIY